jgi:phospholipase C
MNKKTLKVTSAIGVAAILLIAASAYKKATPASGIEKVNHVVVIYMENHSFDNLYGQFEGADGLDKAKSKNVIQLDALGQPYTTLPPVPRSTVFPTNLPNNYFNIDQYVPNDLVTPDVTHLFYQEQLQINGGKMNRFVQYNTTKGLAMGYYDTKQIPLYELAKQYTLCDRFFS